MKSLKMEIHYLKLELEEMSNKNKVLTLNNELLQEKLSKVSKEKTDDKDVIVPVIEIT